MEQENLFKSSANAYAYDLSWSYDDYFVVSFQNEIISFSNCIGTDEHTLVVSDKTLKKQKHVNLKE